MKLYDKYFDKFINLIPSYNDILRIKKYKKLQIHYENNISESYIEKLKLKEFNLKNNKKSIYDECLLYNINHNLEGFKYNLHLMPINQFENHISNYIQLLNGTGYFIFDSTDDYYDVMIKNKEFSIWCSQLIINL